MHKVFREAQHFDNVLNESGNGLNLESYVESLSKADTIPFIFSVNPDFQILDYLSCSFICMSKSKYIQKPGPVLWKIKKKKQPKQNS